MAPTLPENAAGDEEVFYAYQQKPGWANFDRRHAMSAVDLNRFLRFWGRDGQWSGGRGGSYGFWFWQCGELTVDSDRWPDGFSMVFMCNGQVDSRGLAQRIRKVLDDRGNGIR
jgi:hypothetical protein